MELFAALAGYKSQRGLFRARRTVPMFKQMTPALALGLALTAAASFAQMAPMHKPMAKKPMAGKKMMTAKTVYVCKDCKQTYTPMQAKKMGYKDPMGHTLTKMSKAPAGFTPGGTGKM